MAKTAAKRRGNPISRYLRETMAELRKVNWPTRQEATQLTIIVIVVMTVTSIFLGLMDFIFSRAFAFILSLR